MWRKDGCYARGLHQGRAMLVLSLADTQMHYHGHRIPHIQEQNFVFSLQLSEKQQI